VDGAGALFIKRMTLVTTLVLLVFFFFFDVLCFGFLQVEELLIIVEVARGAVCLHYSEGGRLELMVSSLELFFTILVCLQGGGVAELQVLPELWASIVGAGY